jgi:hypothetical protein
MVPLQRQDILIGLPPDTAAAQAAAAAAAAALAQEKDARAAAEAKAATQAADAAAASARAIQAAEDARAAAEAKAAGQAAAAAAASHAATQAHAAAEANAAALRAKIEALTKESEQAEIKSKADAAAAAKTLAAAKAAAATAAPPKFGQSTLSPELVSFTSPEKPLGQGGAADVVEGTYKCASGSTTVALKVFRGTKGLLTAKELAQIKMEVNIGWQIRHENLLHTIGIMEDPKRGLVMVMDLAEQTLHHRLREGAIPIETILAWLQQIAAGMQALHSTMLAFKSAISAFGCFWIPPLLSERSQPTHAL